MQHHASSMFVQIFWLSLGFRIRLFHLWQLWATGSVVLRFSVWNSWIVEILRHEEPLGMALEEILYSIKQARKFIWISAGPLRIGFPRHFCWNSFGHSQAVFSVLEYWPQSFLTVGKHCEALRMLSYESIWHAYFEGLLSLQRLRRLPGHSKQI